MNSSRKLSQEGARQRASAARPVAQPQRGPGGTMQRLATGSARVQGAVQRQASLTRPRTAGPHAVAQLQGRRIANWSAEPDSEHYAVNDDSQGVGFMFGGTTYNGSIMLPTDEATPAKSLPTSGGLYVKDDGGAGVFWVTPDMINDYWEKGSLEGQVNPGSYAPGKGYSLLHQPNELVNCAAYAHGATNWIEPDLMRTHLADSTQYTAVDVASIGDGTYVLSSTFHFIKVVKEADKFITSETNGGSAVYQRTLSKEELEALIAERDYKLHRRV